MSELNRSCREFRAELERALEGRPRAGELTTLSWNEHLLGCGACRALLEREEALEELLASWPKPRLSPERRVALLACLRAEAGDESALDDLLDVDDVAAPSGLAARVLSGVDDARLDALLERDRELAIPSGLASRVLDGLADELAPAPARRFQLDRRLLWPAAVAAGLLLFVQWRARDAQDAPVPDVVEGPDAPSDGLPDGSGMDRVEVAGAEELSDDQDDLLAVLDLLEQDALWDSTTLDLELTTQIEIHEEWLLEYTLEQSGSDAALEGDANDASETDDADSGRDGVR